jgi:LPS-assembly lipoprotein
MTSSLRLVVASVALALAACGFQLRGAANYAFESIYVGAPPTLPFTVELKRALAGAGSAKVVDAPQGAQVVLDIANISDDKSVLSLSPGGRAREFLLVKRVMFGLRGADGGSGCRRTRSRSSAPTCTTTPSASRARSRSSGC